MMMLLNGPNDPYTYSTHTFSPLYQILHPLLISSTFFVDIIFALSTFDFAHPCGSLHIMNYK